MKSIRPLAACLIIAAFLGAPGLAAAQEAQPDLAQGKQLFTFCAQCHGDAAEGKQNIGAPAIAGMPAWYVKDQLRKFSVGLRGKHFDDAEGMRMRPMSLWLIAQRHASGELAAERARATAAEVTAVAENRQPTQGEREQLDPNIVNVAAYVASLPATNPAKTLSGGNAANGEANYPGCSSCHGQHGEGTEVLTAPPLAGQSDWYLLSALRKYKAGVRGYDSTNDSLAFMMSAMSGALLPDEQAMQDMVAYLATLQTPKK